MTEMKINKFNEMLDERNDFKYGEDYYANVFDKLIKYCLRRILDNNEIINYSLYQLKSALHDKDEIDYHFNRNQNSWIKDDDYKKRDIERLKEKIKDTEKKIKDIRNEIKGYHLLVYKPSLDLINTWGNFATYRESKANALKIKSSYDNVCDDVLTLNTDVFGIIGEFVGLDGLKNDANLKKVKNFGRKVWNELFNQSHLLNKLTKSKLYGIMVNLDWIFHSSHGSGYDAYFALYNWTPSKSVVNKNLKKSTLIKYLVSNRAKKIRDRFNHPAISNSLRFYEESIDEYEEDHKNNSPHTNYGFDEFNTGNRLKIIDYLTKMQIKILLD
jgi:hypothetical protein